MPRSEELQSSFSTTADVSGEVHVQTGPEVAGVEKPAANAPPVEAAHGGHRGVRGPRVSHRIMDPAPEPESPERELDSGTEYAGTKREQETAPVRSDGVTVARLLSNMTSTHAASGARQGSRKERGPEVSDGGQ